MANQMTNIVFKLNEEAVKRAYDEFENSSELAIKTAIMSIPDFLTSWLITLTTEESRLQMTLN